MKDIIYRQDAIDKMRKLPRWNVIRGYNKNEGFLYDDVMYLLDNLSPARIERKKGEWEEIEVIPQAYDIAGVKTWASKMRCNQCGFTTFAIEGRFVQYDFCPHCGARMNK